MMPQACYCTLDEALDGHRCHCLLHKWCGEVECDKNPDQAERDRALGVNDEKEEER